MREEKPCCVQGLVRQGAKNRPGLLLCENVWNNRLETRSANSLLMQFPADF
jgi:hypothetical protein